jgi:hypothetical protein
VSVGPSLSKLVGDEVCLCFRVGVCVSEPRRAGTPVGSS